MLLTTEQAAARIGLSASWLCHSRQTGTGPAYVKIGARVKYRPEDVDAWLIENKRLKVWNFDEEAA